MVDAKGGGDGRREGPRRLQRRRERKHRQAPRAAGGPMPVPSVLRDAAGWVWRLATVGAAAYGLVWLLALLYPGHAAVHRGAAHQHPGAPARGLAARGPGRAGLSTWLTFLAGFVVLGGICYFIALASRRSTPALVRQFQQVIESVHGLLHQRFGDHQVMFWRRAVRRTSTTAVCWVTAIRR